MPNCLICGAVIDENDSAYYARGLKCIPCYTRSGAEARLISCSRCGTRISAERAMRKRGSVYCSYCMSELERQERKPKCPLCRRTLESWQKTTKLSNNKVVHSSCAKEKQGREGPKTYCSYCQKETDSFRVLDNGLKICPKCDSKRGSKHDATILGSLVDKIGSMLG